MPKEPIRLINTGIRREWIGWRFILYALALGGEFRKVVAREYPIEILWVPEREWPELREEYLAYDPNTDKSWTPLGNTWNAEHDLMCVEAYVA